MPSSLAEVQAEVLTEAFNVNLESLVTKDYLAAQMAEQRAYMDTRFAEQDARFETRFADLNSKIRTLYVMVSIIMAAVILPYLERLLAL